MYGIKGIDHVARQGAAEDGHRRLLSERPVVDGVAGDLADDRGERGGGVQRAVRHPVRHVPRGRRAARRRDDARRASTRSSTRAGSGCKMNDAARADIVKAHRVRRRRVASLPERPPAGRHHPRHDRRRAGNVSMEHEGAYLGVLDVALAARNSGGIVIAQVKRTVARGAIPAQRAYVPSTLVDYVVVDAGPDAGDADALRPGDLGRGAEAPRRVRAGRMGAGEGDRAARGDGARAGRRGEPRIRHLAARAAGSCSRKDSPTR